MSDLFMQTVWRCAKNRLFNEETNYPDPTGQKSDFHNTVILTAITADSEKAVKLKWRGNYSVFLSILEVATQ